LIFLGIWCNVDDLFILMPKGAIYSQGKYVIFFIAATGWWIWLPGSMGRSLRILPTIICYLAHVRISVLTVVTNLIFIPRYSINGAAFAYTISFLVFTALKLGLFGLSSTSSLSAPKPWFAWVSSPLLTASSNSSPVRDYPLFFLAEHWF